MKKDITPEIKFANGDVYQSVELIPLGKGRVRVICGGLEGTAVRGNQGYNLTLDNGRFVVRNTTKQGLRNFTPVAVFQYLNPIKSS